MKCFYHGDADAVAVCRSCGRGVCHECAVEVGTATACRNRCESDVEALNDIVQRNRTVYQKTSKVHLWIGLFFGGIALLYLYSGLRSLASDTPDTFGIIFGSLFATMGVVFWISSRRMRAK